MRISDWSSDVCSSDLMLLANIASGTNERWKARWFTTETPLDSLGGSEWAERYHIWRMDWNEKEIALYVDDILLNRVPLSELSNQDDRGVNPFRQPQYILLNLSMGGFNGGGSDAHTSKLQSIMHISYSVV